LSQIAAAPHENQQRCIPLTQTTHIKPNAGNSRLRGQRIFKQLYPGALDVQQPVPGKQQSQPGSVTPNVHACPLITLIRHN
jgi:hypothetical protein